MNDTVETWHYGLVARYWAENNTTGPEIDYFQRQIELFGQPALDAGCGTGRLLIPFLRAGLDVDGCDVSGDMLAYCQQAVDRSGLSVRLYEQALHNLDLPRRYQTIVACGVFGIGTSRDQDFSALQLFYLLSLRLFDHNSLRGHLKSDNMVNKISLDFVMFVARLNKHEKKTIPH